MRILESVFFLLIVIESYLGILPRVILPWIMQEAAWDYPGTLVMDDEHELTRGDQGTREEEAERSSLLSSYDDVKRMTRKKKKKQFRNQTKVLMRKQWTTVRLASWKR